MNKTALATSSLPRTLERRSTPVQENDGKPLPIGEQAVLTACIQFPDGVKRNRLTVLTGYKRSSRDQYIARLKIKGLVTIVGSVVMATDNGRSILPDIEPLPTGIELQNYWLENLPKGEKKILALLLEAYPNAIRKSVIDEETGCKVSSRNQYLSRMAAKQLVEFTSVGEVRAVADLF